MPATARRHSEREARAGSRDEREAAPEKGRRSKAVPASRAGKVERPNPAIEKRKDGKSSILRQARENAGKPGNRGINRKSRKH
jgi:hypothetical protein